jgi:restriction system protein
MALWLVRAGRAGEREDFVLEHGLAAVGWDELPDLAPIHSKEDLEQLFRTTYPGDGPGRIANHVGQVWAFRDRMKEGDLVALPLKKRAAIALGRVKGPYQFRPDLPGGVRHTRPVEWLRQDLPRSAFDQDLLYSLGAFMTVCRIERNNAEQRVRALLDGKAAPAPVMPQGQTAVEPVEASAPPDLEEFALDQIRTFVGQKFRGHSFARLVSALLTAQGYRAQASPPGADGGVDIVAGRGPMGFDPPRLCVQVKSSDTPEDVKTLRELQGVMRNFGAEQGLLVAWGGFKSSVHAEARRHFFEIRLWDAGDVVKALLENYERLPEDVQAELPLKRIWSLVLEE